MRIPCVICGLRLDNSSCNPSFEYESGNDMRDHLVEHHSRYVSRALLAPDLNNKTHFWLFTNVDYSAASNSMNANTSTTNPLLDETMGAAFLLNTLLSSVQPNLEMKNDMLMDFLNSGALNTLLNGCTEENNSSNTTTDESVEDQHHEIETQSRPDGLIDSKAMRKATCQICNVKVCSTARQRHVYLIHLKQPDMFMCSACDYTNSNSIWEMRKHCVAQHGGAAEAISNEEKHKDIIQKWNQKCFPDWKQKKANGWCASEKIENEPRPASNFAQNFELDDELSKSIQDVINTSISIQNVGNLNVKSEFSPTEASNVATSSSSVNDIEEEYGDEMMEDEFSGRCSSVTDSVADNRDTGNASAKIQASNDRICHLCWEESRYPGRHIAQKHLKKPLYECPVCMNFGSYESCTVAKHIMKVHPDSGESQPVSNLEKFADEIRDLQARCFPNRPMKLVRAHQGSRPRERHHCRLCDTLVAQSDRQRHVYHRHLQRSRIFECPICDFASNYDVHRVKWHIKWIHKDAPSGMEPISHENEYRDEIDALNEECFPGWQHRKRPFWWLEGEENGGQKRAETPDKTKPATRQRKAVEEPSPKKPHVEKEEEREDSEIFVVKKKIEAPENSGNPSNLDWTCQLCLKEFKPSSNFLRHVAKDHLNIPLYQCPICKGHGGQDAYEVRSHMLRVHGASDLEPISNVEANVEQIQKVYQECFPGRKFKNVGIEKKLNHDIKTYEEPRVQCKECGMEMKTEDRQIHVYRHHLKEPRLYECPLCDFSHHACSSDVKAHIKYVHRDNPDAVPKANLILFSNDIQYWNDKCFPGWINRRLPAVAVEDFNRCRLCDVEVRQTSRHIAEVHLMIPLHQCPLCEYGAAESRLVKRHMKNNHKKKDIKGLDPIANVVEHRASFSALHDQCFPGRPKRLSNITISEEGRRAKCKQCGLTISKKRRLSHMLEKHMKKVMFRCPHCSFTSTHDSSIVETHIEESHSHLKKRGVVVSELAKHVKELKELAKNCFNDSEFKII